MEKVVGYLLIPCTGPGCNNDLIVNEKNLSVCSDEDNMFFGIYVRCDRDGCGSENLVRDDIFLSKNLLIVCPGCDHNYPVSAFNWDKSEKYRLFFEAHCKECDKRVGITWNY